MGFERAVAIIQGTKNLTDFSGTTSNYETDVFRPIFDELEKLSGKKYTSTLPDVQGSTPGSGVAIGGSPIEKVAASAATNTPAACAPQNKSKSTSPSASSRITFARFRLRLPTELPRRTKDVVTFCVASCVARSATAARSVFTNRSSTNSSTSLRKPWATSFRKSATQAIKDQRDNLP